MLTSDIIESMNETMASDDVYSYPYSGSEGWDSQNPMHSRQALREAAGVGHGGKKHFICLPRPTAPVLLNSRRLI
jgi:hypothetical protein